MAGTEPRSERQGWTMESFDSFAAADAADAAYWLSRTPVERMQALERIRAMNYGYAKDYQSRPRLQRVHRVAELGGR